MAFFMNSMSCSEKPPALRFFSAFLLQFYATGSALAPGAAAPFVGSPLFLPFPPILFILIFGPALSFSF
jgi:hypothetical protein